MQEDFLYYLWKQGKFDQELLSTTNGERVKIIHPGYRNDDSGPDFFNARIRIGDFLWAGNVEIHVRSSDWFRHGRDAVAARFRGCSSGSRRGVGASRARQ